MSTQVLRALPDAALALVVGKNLQHVVPQSFDAKALRAASAARQIDALGARNKCACTAHRRSPCVSPSSRSPTSITRMPLSAIVCDVFIVCEYPGECCAIPHTTTAVAANLMNVRWSFACTPKKRRDGWMPGAARWTLRRHHPLVAW